MNLAVRNVRCFVGRQRSARAEISLVPERFDDALTAGRGRSQRKGGTSSCSPNKPMQLKVPHDGRKGQWSPEHCESLRDFRERRVFEEPEFPIERPEDASLTT